MTFWRRLGGDTWPVEIKLGPRTKAKHLITADELRAAGALSTPASRKSLGRGRGSGERQRELFPLFGDEDDTPDENDESDTLDESEENDEPTPSDADDDQFADDDESADEPQ